jgi:CheY-like chemotaxis protein
MLHSVIGENIQLETRLSPDLGRVRIDPGQMERVFLNLVLNARDAMPGGGRIIIETANGVLGEKEAREHGAAPGPAVQFTITDTGGGIDAETMAHIFEPLFTTKGNGRGTGLGLSTVRGIVRQNGGEVQARSSPGHGTTFTVSLPQAAPASGISDAATPESPRPDAGSETILLVEDEGNVRHLFAHVLGERGYKVMEAAHAEEALDLLARHRGGIDLLCTDLVMPGISGRELAERIRLRQPDLRVVYMSGYNTDALVGMGLLAPGVPYLQKPLRPAALAAEVRGALDRPLHGAAEAG